MDDLSRFCCQNHPCPAYGKRDAKKRTVTAPYGPDNPRHMLRCRTCKVRFSDRQGPVLFHAKRTAQTVGAILEHLSQRWGGRATGRLGRVNRAPVGRSRALAGDPARHLHQDLVAFAPADPCGPVR